MSELTERLRQLARQQADGTCFHNGRELTAEDSMYWVAADEIDRLASPTPSNDGEGVIERMEGRIRILVWNREKAAGRSDEAAMKAVEEEIAALKQGAGG